jgi:hypothetical protein
MQVLAEVSKMIAPPILRETHEQERSSIHTPPTNWGFAEGSVLMTEEPSVREDSQILPPSLLQSRGNGRPPRSSPLRSSSSSIVNHSFSSSSIDMPRSTSAGGIVISARLQMALVRANDRPTSCPGDLEGRLTSEYFRPSTGNASVVSLSSLLSGGRSGRSRSGSRNQKRPSTGSFSSRPTSSAGSIGSVEESHASTMIQSVVRMKRANIYTWNPDGGLAANSAVVKIQRIYRGFIVRFRKHIIAREKAAAAAIQIQAILRGQLGRFHAMDLRVQKRQDALLLVQCAWRIGIAQRRVHTLRLHKQKIHAIKIQAWWRGTFVKYVLNPNPIQLRKRRRALQRASMRKHVSQIETARSNEAKQKLLKKRMKQAAAQGLIVSSRRSRKRNQRRGPTTDNGGDRRGRGRRRLRAPVIQPVDDTPVDPIALLREALLYHAVDGCRNFKRVRKIFQPNVPFVKSSSLPLNQEVASFVRVALVHALSFEGTADAVGDALASLQNITSQKYAVDASEDNNNNNNNTRVSPKSRRGKRSRGSPQKSKLPQMAYSNVLRDYYHANVLKHPNDLEGMRYLLTALLVGIETHWNDPFECGEYSNIILINKNKNKQQFVELKGRLERISQRLMQGAKLAVKFRKQSQINARRAVAEEEAAKQGHVLSKRVPNKSATPRGMVESKEEKQLRQCEFIVKLMDNWFFAPLVRISEASNVDTDTGVEIQAYQRGNWLVLQSSLSDQQDLGEQNEQSTAVVVPSSLSSYVVSPEELNIVFGIKTMNNKTMDGMSARRVLQHVKVLRGSTIVVIPVERRRAFMKYSRKRKAAAIVVQRCYKGRRLLNAMQRRIALYQRSHANHTVRLNKVLAEHEAAHAHHVNLVSMVKAAFIARRQRKQLRGMHAMAVKIQRVMRAYLVWLREEEKKAWEKYGAQVRTMYDRCRIVSGKAMVVRVQRAGKNWMLRGIDHSVGEIYQGLVKEQQLLRLIKKYPYGRDQGYSIKRRAKLYAWEHSRILLLLLSCLATTDAIDGLGELNGFDGKRIMICHEEFGNKAQGASILCKIQGPRLLEDTKDCIPKDPKAAPDEL